MVEGTLGDLAPVLVDCLNRGKFGEAVSHLPFPPGSDLWKIYFYGADA
jgi:hypothetical protein